MEGDRYRRFGHREVARAGSVTRARWNGTERRKGAGTDPAERGATTGSGITEPVHRGRRRAVALVRHAAVVLLAGTTTVVLSCSRPAVSPACGRQLGYLGAVSASPPELDTALHRGASLAVERYNRQHTDCPVTLVELDSGDDAAKAATLAGQAVADTRLLGVIGPAYSAEATAVFPVLDRAGLVAVTPSASQTDLSGNGWRTFHRAVVTDAAQAAVAASYIRDVLRAKRVYVVDDGSTYGASSAAVVHGLLAGLAVGTERVGSGQDLAGAVARIRSADADVVYYGGFHYGAGPLLGQLRRAGVPATLVGGEGIDSPALSQQTGGAGADGTVATCAACQEITDAGFRDAFRSRYASAPTGYAAVAYDVANIFLAGLRHGAGTRAAMLSYVQRYDGTGVAGRYRFTPTGELVTGRSTVGVVVVRNGQFAWVKGEPA
jgi:branched-chain amino acid transport system substrate-binding protein